MIEELWRSKKRSGWPQYLVEPQHIEGYFEGGGQSNLVLLSPAGLSRTYASSLSRYSAGGALAEIMKGINLGYAQYYKGKNNHIGHFWQDRYKSIIISKDEYLLACGSYVELNPVRARIVEDPKDYKWSSYGAYAYGETVSVVERHGIHNALAEEAGERRKKYREFVRGMLREKKAMKEEMGRRVVYGNKAFIKKMQMAYKVEALIKPKGRLRKSANDNN